MAGSVGPGREGAQNRPHRAPPRREVRRDRDAALQLGEAWARAPRPAGGGRGGDPWGRGPSRPGGRLNLSARHASNGPPTASDPSWVSRVARATEPPGGWRDLGRALLLIVGLVAIGLLA